VPEATLRSWDNAMSGFGRLVAAVFLCLDVMTLVTMVFRTAQYFVFRSPYYSLAADPSCSKHTSLFGDRRPHPRDLKIRTPMGGQLRMGSNPCE